MAVREVTMPALDVIARAEPDHPAGEAPPHPDMVRIPGGTFRMGSPAVQWVN
jgi:formylglycine-generating enzyme required for sulfatase activity